MKAWLRKDERVLKIKNTNDPEKEQQQYRRYQLMKLTSGLFNFPYFMHPQKQLPVKQSKIATVILFLPSSTQAPVYPDMRKGVNLVRRQFFLKMLAF